MKRWEGDLCPGLSRTERIQDLDAIWFDLDVSLEDLGICHIFCHPYIPGGLADHETLPLFAIQNGNIQYALFL